MDLKGYGNDALYFVGFVFFASFTKSFVWHHWTVAPGRQTPREPQEYSYTKINRIYSLTNSTKTHKHKNGPYLSVSCIQQFCSGMASVFGVRRCTLCVYNGFWEPFWHLFSDVFGDGFCIDFLLTFYRFSVPLNLAKSDFYVGRVANFMVLQASIFIRF